MGLTSYKFWKITGAIPGYNTQQNFLSSSKEKENFLQYKQVKEMYDQPDSGHAGL